MAKKKANSENPDTMNSIETMESEAPKETSGGESKDTNISGYWKNLLNEHPHLLKQRSNDELYSMWFADHPGETVISDAWKQGLSNVKTILRNKKGLKKKNKQREQAPVESGNGSPAPARAPRKSGSLEAIEDLLDECLSLARTVDPLALEKVIQHLKLARRDIVIKLNS